MKGDIKLESRRLMSGNFQVKFTLDQAEGKGLYGYLLVSPGTTLKEVIIRIRKSISDYRNTKGTGIVSLLSGEYSTVHIYKGKQ
ncbi:MAG: hypothetical protein OEX02_20200 [Cyclobacteriaceae bacterium]|nr:hypothetical protein [Cyclobacteriaceae bacterium]